MNKPLEGEWIIINDAGRKRLTRWTFKKDTPQAWQKWPGDKSQEQKTLLR